jgi:hypothetical protein
VGRQCRPTCLPGLICSCQLDECLLPCFSHADFERRFMTLLGSAFRSMPPALCLRCPA